MMVQNKSSVRNAADPEQVKDAEQREKSLLEQNNNDIIAVCSTDEGRRVLWRILSHCKTFNSVWSPSAQIHYNSGMQDVGHFVMGLIVEADPEMLIKMMKENRR